MQYYFNLTQEKSRIYVKVMKISMRLTMKRAVILYCTIINDVLLTMQLIAFVIDIFFYLLFTFIHVV